MGSQIVNGVPRYYQPYDNDCFATAYGALLQHMGQNPNLILADYMSFMFDEQSGFIGVNFLFRYSSSVIFSEVELNSSLAAVHFPATAVYNSEHAAESSAKHTNKLVFRMLIHDEAEVAEQRVRELIDAGRPVIVFVDLNHMHYHPAYQKDHGLHSIVITGYDDEAQQYHMFDKYIMANSDFDGSIAMDDIRKGRVSNCPITNPIIGRFNRHIRHLWIEITGGESFEMTTDMMASVLQESSRRMSGHVRVHDQITGFAAMRAFREYLKKLDLTNMDERMIYMFRGYYCSALKQLARQRRRFAVFISEMPESLLSDSNESISEALNEASKHWDIVANTALKLGISKRPTLIDNIVQQLIQLEEMEKKILDKIGHSVSAIT